MGLVSAIGAGLGAVGSIVSGNSANKASKRAAETSQQNNAENVALARDIYGQNKDIINPFVQRGNAAGDQINALLGLSQPQATPQARTFPQAQPNALSQFYGGAPYNEFTNADFAEQQQQDVSGFGGRTYGAGLPYGLGDNFITTGTFANGGFNANPTAGQVPGFTTTQAPQTNPQQDAFDGFRNSTGYQFRLGEGLDAVTSAYAGMGGLQSGAALRGITDYGQNFASNEFGNYLNALGSQQAIGAGSASALAGVGQNFAGTVINSNNQNAANQMNAQLGQQSPFGNALGLAGGILAGI